MICTRNRHKNQEQKEEAIVCANQVRNIIANAGQLQKFNSVYKDK